MLSLMQMAKVSAALARFDQAGGLFISVLTNPTMGGVAASFASLGDVVFAEPKALIGFAGPRTIKATIRIELPKGFQTSEFLLEHGFIDRIVRRKDLKSEIARTIDYCGKSLSDRHGALFDRSEIAALAGRPRRRVEAVRPAARGDLRHDVEVLHGPGPADAARSSGLKILDIEKTAALEARFRASTSPAKARSAMRLKHPRIVETYEYGLTTDGAQYLVMEFLEGADFNSLIVGRDPLPGRPPRCVSSARRPRRWPPSTPPASSTATSARETSSWSARAAKDLKLIDFGLTVPATPPFMQPGVRTGNPNYMAPEIVRRKPTDQRVDVFAFGVTAYEICTGQLPWLRGATGLAAMTHDQPADRHPPAPPQDPPRAWPRRSTGAWRPSRPGAAPRWSSSCGASRMSRATTPDRSVFLSLRRGPCEDATALAALLRPHAEREEYDQSVPLSLRRGPCGGATALAALLRPHAPA